MKRILIFDTYYIARAALRSILEEQSADMTIVEVTSPKEMFAELSAGKYDLLIMDTFIPEGPGFGIVERIRRSYPETLILIFSSAAEDFYGTFYLKVGANGFLSKNAKKEEIGQAISAILEKGSYLSGPLSHQIINGLNTTRPKGQNPLKELSVREVEVMDLLIEGLWLKEIACKLHVTESSISTYKSRIFNKLEVSNVIDLYRKVSFYKSRRMIS